MNSTRKMYPAKKAVISFYLILLCFACLHTAAAEQSFWEGRISAAPYGLLPNTGLYAASNAFPLDSKVAITSADGNKKIEVRVVERLDVDRVFMQVSPEAAKQLELKTNEILIARVSPVMDETSAVEKSLAQESPYSRDPDVNPSTAASGSRLTMIQEYLKEDAGEAPAEMSRQPEAPELSEAPAERKGAWAAPSGTAEVTAAISDDTSPSDGEPVAHAIPDRAEEPETFDPAVELPAPERQPSILTAEIPEEAGDTEPADSGGPRVVAMEPLFPGEKDYSYSPLPPEKPEGRTAGDGPRVSMDSIEPADAADSGAMTAQHSPGLPDRGEAVADLGSPAEEPQEEEDVAAVHDPEMPAEIPEEAELVLVPAEERPPEGPPTVGPAETALTKPKEEERKPAETMGTSVIGGPVSVASNLQKRSYYLQIGAYSKLESAKNNAAVLSSRYPVMIYSDTGGAAPYKLMIGPLNEDESDTLLYTLSSRGYPDAFVRRGN